MASSEPVTAAVEIGPTDIDELRDKARALWVAHYREIATNPKVMKLNPDWKKYYELELRDELACLGARRFGELVGYSVNIITQHLHYSEMTYMENDVLYLADKERKGGVGAMLIDATIEMARGLECKMITFHAKPGTALCRMLGGPGFEIADDQKVGYPQKSGFQVQDIVFSKVL